MNILINSSVCRLLTGREKSDLGEWGICLKDNESIYLDNTIAVPLYRQLEERLRAEIESGHWPAGSRRPTENELVARSQVSRVTVRKALAELSACGYLERKSGKGTFVAEKKIQRPISGVLSFTEMCKVLGFTAGAKTVKLSIEEPTPKDVQQLQISENSQILVLERIRYADGKAVVLERSRLTEDFFFLMHEDMQDASMYDIMKKRKNIQFTKSTKVLDIVYATSQEARFLNITKNYPLLRISSIVEDITEQYRYLSEQLYIADKFKLIV